MRAYTLGYLNLFLYARGLVCRTRVNKKKNKHLLYDRRKIYNARGMCLYMVMRQRQYVSRISNPDRPSVSGNFNDSLFRVAKEKGKKVKIKGESTRNLV